MWGAYNWMYFSFAVDAWAYNWGGLWAAVIIRELNFSLLHVSLLLSINIFFQPS